MTQYDSQKVGRVLIVSRDFVASRYIGDSMQQNGLSVENSVDLSAASERLSRRKFEAIVVDLSFGHSAVYFMQQIRNSPSNRTVVTFAITNDQEDISLALKHGFSFVLERPLTAESIANTLKVAYGMIVRERRRYFRHPTVVPAVLQRKEASEVYVRTINVSEGGIAINTLIPLAVGLQVNIEFTLRDPKLMIKADGKVCWQNANGDAGLAFGFIPFDMASGLQQWLSLKLELQLPSHLAEKFGRSQKQ
jgi:CheY-like chemotaxis protein